MKKIRNISLLLKTFRISRNDTIFFIMFLSILLLSKTENYYIIGIIPMFPLFLIITLLYYRDDLQNIKKVIISTVVNILPYLLYLTSFYIFKIYLQLPFLTSVFFSILIWVLAASTVYLLTKEKF